MLRIPFLVAVLFCASASTCAGVDFNRDIRPILSNHCFQCHGPDAEHREAELRLDDEESAIGDRDGYAVIDRKNPEESELLARIDATDPDAIMPPPDVGKELSAEQRSLLHDWISTGAEWHQHWAYQRPRKFDTPPLPEGNHWPIDRLWANNWIDHFVADKIASVKLTPSVDADLTTLIRRVSFDLTGLPPSPTQVERFVSDQLPGNFQRLVDELIASPAFGERMAMYWLDLGSVCGHRRIPWRPGSQRFTVPRLRDRCV